VAGDSNGADDAAERDDVRFGSSVLAKPTVDDAVERPAGWMAVVWGSAELEANNPVVDGLNAKAIR
jgi:hypothetical protein